MPGDSELSALRTFFDRYLRQDFVVTEKTPAVALDAYCREADRRELLELESDFDRFMDKTSALDFSEVRELFVKELKSGWVPPNRAALARLLRMVHTRLVEK